MKYDDASWHYGGNFPENLDDEAGATHIAMFVAWCVLNGLSGELHLEDFADDLDRLRTRVSTPGEWFLANCDGKFTDEDLSEEGNAFADYYYAREEAQYLGDYGIPWGRISKRCITCRIRGNPTTCSALSSAPATRIGCSGPLDSTASDSAMKNAGEAGVKSPPRTRGTKRTPSHAAVSSVRGRP